MGNFPDIDQIHEMLDEIAETVPKDFYRELNGGIILSEDIKIHEESVDHKPLYILGQYKIDRLGRSIVIYYGSISKVYEYASISVIYDKLEEILFHEFTHHIESLAGEKGLEIKDHIFMEEYRNSLEE